MKVKSCNLKWNDDHITFLSKKYKNQKSVCWKFLFYIWFILPNLCCCSETSILWSVIFGWKKKESMKLLTGWSMLTFSDLILQTAHICSWCNLDCNQSVPRAFWLWGPALITVVVFFYHNQNAVGSRKKNHCTQVKTLRWSLKKKENKLVVASHSYKEKYMFICTGMKTEL